MALIEDGGGAGRYARVTERFRLETEGVQRSAWAAASQDEGKTFFAATGFVPFAAAAGETALYYHKNTSEEAQYLHLLRTCGEEVQKWRLIKNPTAGTIVTAGADITPRNLDTASPVSLIAALKAGNGASTITDGEPWAQWINRAGHSVYSFDGALILRPGGSMAIVGSVAADGDVCVTALWTKE